jgi:hypothetical protein
VRCLKKEQDRSYKLDNPYLKLISRQEGGKVEPVKEENPYLNIKPALETAKTMITEPWGVGEAALNLATQTYGLPAMGLAGIAGLPFGRSQEWSEAVGKGTIYQPQTEAGRKITEAVSVPFEMLGRASEKVADIATKPPISKKEAIEAFPEIGLYGERVSEEPSPLMGTVAGTAVMASPMLLGLKKGTSPKETPSVLPKGLVTTMPEVNPYIGLMENRINTLRKQVKGMVEYGKSERGSLGEPSPVTSPKGWTSALQSTIEQKMPNSAPAEQVMNIVKGAGVKGDEIKWSGLDDFLKGKTKVGKAELMNYLKENQVEVKEIIKEGQSSPAEGIKQFGGGTTKFSQWQLPGGENYRELLLQLPTQTMDKIKSTTPISGIEYRGAHWDEPNVLAHVRFNDRVDAQGKKVLFIEEVQSDWHQAGREKGYATTIKDLPEGYRIGQMGAGNLFSVWDKDNNVIISHIPGPSFAEAKQYAITRLNQQQRGVSEAPFSKTWHEMAMRRMVRWAAENGYDKVAWTTGEMQAARYDLSKHLDSIEYSRDGELYGITGFKDNQPVLPERFITETELPNNIGKDLAQKMISGEGKPRGDYKVFSGLDLKVGGEGMKGFYDKIIPEYMNKFGKKWGAKVGELKIGIGKGTPIYTGPEWTEEMGKTLDKIATDENLPVSITRAAQDVIDLSGRSERSFKQVMEMYGNETLAKMIGGKLERAGESSTVHSLDITPSMKQSVLKEGLPLFQLAPPVAVGAGLAAERLMRKKEEK